MTHDENRISDLIDGGLHDKSAIDRAKYELHLRRIAAIEEAAKNDTGGWYEQQAFIRGAQHVIEHPDRYGLVPAAHTAALQERVKELEVLLNHVVYEYEQGEQSFATVLNIKETIKNG